MKSTQRITRVKLKINQEVEFLLMGIVSAEPDYKLSLNINNKFRISLKNTLVLKSFDESGCELSFSRFSDTDNSSGLVYNLISNRSGNNYFLKKLKNVDYIFQIHYLEKTVNTNEIIAHLRDIESVSAVFKIDINSFKDKNIQYLIH